MNSEDLARRRREHEASPYREEQVNSTHIPEEFFDEPERRHPLDQRDPGDETTHVSRYQSAPFGGREALSPAVDDELMPKTFTAAKHEGVRLPEGDTFITLPPLDPNAYPGNVMVPPDEKVYYFVSSDICRHPSSARFHEVLKLAGEMHDAKQADYGRDDDPFANVRASEDFGTPGWIGTLQRANDKMKRLQKFARTGNVSFEKPLEDILDLAVYAVIAYVLLEEDQA